MSIRADIAEKQLARTWRGWFFAPLSERRKIRQIISQGDWLVTRPHFRKLIERDRGKAHRELNGELRGYVKESFGGWAIILRLLVPLIVQILLNLVTVEET